MQGISFSHEGMYDSSTKVRWFPVMDFFPLGSPTQPGSWHRHKVQGVVKEANGQFGEFGARRYELPLQGGPLLR